MKSFVVAGALAAALIVSAASSFAGSPAADQQGARKPMGSGFVSSWIRRDAQGTPQAFGVSFDAAALAGLGAKENEIVLPLPADAALSYRSAVVDWHPHGHPPAKVYDVPHLDFHFYVIDEATRLAIAESGPLAAVTPSPAEVPAGFVGGPTVPGMGQHYIAKSAPEFNGGHFTMTPIFGYYDGKPSFVEAMVTLDALQARQTVNAPLAQPSHWAVPGMHPTRWSVTYDAKAGRYDVAFDGLTK